MPLAVRYHAYRRIFLRIASQLWETEGLVITVADILALPAFENVELVAPCEGAEQREVRNVGILDCPPDYNEYSVYVAGELILTNLGFAFGNPDMAEKSLLAMLHRDVAAIAIKIVYEPPISDVVRKESTARGVPLYLYDGAYHETVAYQSLDLLQRDRDELDKGNALDELLTNHDGDQVRKRLSTLVGVTGSKLQCFAFALRAGDTCSFYAMLDSVSCGLAAAKDAYAAIESVGACRYREHILAFVSYGSVSDEEQAAAEQRCIAAASTEGRLHCGASETVSLSDGDLAIRQALAAASSAQRHGDQLVRWSELHLSAFASAVRQDRLFMSASNLYHSMLAGYDEERGTELTHTAAALVDWHGDVKAVAEELHQHPNTVRYRMRKMKAVLGIPHEDDKVFINLLSLVFLPDSDAPRR